MDADTLAEKLEKVFGALVPPAVLVSHQCPECESVHTAFEGRTWNATPTDAVTNHHESLPLLTPEAFVSVLPAYLLVAIRDPLGQIAPSVLYSLQPSANRRGAPFTAEQRELLLEIADWLAARESWGIDMTGVRRNWSRP